MQFCQKHWDELKEAVKVRRLDKFVAKDGKEVIDKIEAQLKGESDLIKPYDPLMSAHWMIVTRALEMGGIYLMTGSYCPLCELEKYTPEKAQTWIDGSTDAVFEDFIDHGWIVKN